MIYFKTKLIQLNKLTSLFTPTNATHWEAKEDTLRLASAHRGLCTFENETQSCWTQRSLSKRRILRGNSILQKTRFKQATYSQSAYLKVSTLSKSKLYHITEQVISYHLFISIVYNDVEIDTSIDSDPMCTFWVVESKLSFSSLQEMILVFDFLKQTKVS